MRFAISTGACAPADFANMRYGVGTAQRGWATPADVINTWVFEKLKQFLEKAVNSATSEPRFLGTGTSVPISMGG